MESVGDIDHALDRADREGFTREPPKTLKGRINFLFRQLKSTKAVARELGVSQRSVERYRKGDRKTPPKPVADRIDTAVRAASAGPEWAKTGRCQRVGTHISRPKARRKGLSR